MEESKLADEPLDRSRSASNIMGRGAGTRHQLQIGGGSDSQRVGDNLPTEVLFSPKFGGGGAMDSAPDSAPPRKQAESGGAPPQSSGRNLAGLIGNMVQALQPGKKRK